MTRARWWVIGALAVLTVTVIVLDVTGVIFPSTPDAVPPPALVFASPVAASEPLTVVDPSTEPSLSGNVLSQVRKALSDDSLGKDVRAIVTSADGELLLADNTTRPTAPASAMKLLTALSVLDVLSPDTRLPTSVMSGSGSDTYVLVGGGDASLAIDRPKPSQPHVASLEALAKKTSKALKKSGESQIHLGFDDSAFSGPAVSPHWEPTYLTSGVIAPVTALMADQGLVSHDSLARYPDPAAAAADEFADLLKADGITLTGKTSRVQLSDSAGTKPIAQVASPPVVALIQEMLRDSDNQMAEALSRVAAAAAGQPASFDGGVTAMVAAAADHQITVDPDSVFDASGLSRDDAVTVKALVSVLQLASTDDQFRAIFGGLPVAGFDGTLDDRYLEPPQAAGAGVVRAKTGTLTGISTETGATVTCDGALVLFSFASNEVSDTFAARDALDRAASALTTCG